MRCMVSDVILLGCSTSVSSEVIFESIMDAENVNNMLQLYRNTMIIVIRIKRNHPTDCELAKSRLQEHSQNFQECSRSLNFTRSRSVMVSLLIIQHIFHLYKVQLTNLCQFSVVERKRYPLQKQNQRTIIRKLSQLGGGQVKMTSFLFKRGRGSEP